MNMKYFTFSELLYSETAVKNKIWNGANAEQEKNLFNLVENVLDPLRLFYGEPIRVNSGFRSEKLNSLVKGAKNSQHLRGEAADIDTGTREGNRKLAKLIIEHKLPFDQLIDEANYSWLHVSYKDDGNNRGQILRMNKGKYTIISPEQL